MKSDVGTD